MWIKRLRTKGFGCLGNRDFEFVNGLNLIYGPNEAGKTTLFEAIEEALLERPRFVRDYQGSAEVLLVTEKGEIWTGTKGKKLLNMSKSFFESVFFVRTGELGFKEPKDFMRDLKGRLLDVERLYKALDFIGERLGKDLKEKRKVGSLVFEIERMRRELAELEKKKVLFEERAQGFVRLRAFLLQREELERDLEALERKSSLYKKAKEKQYLRERYKALLEEMNQRRALEGFLARKEELSTFTPQRIEEIRASERDLERKRERMRTIREELNRLEQGLEEKEGEYLKVAEARRDLILQEEKARLKYEALKDIKSLEEKKKDLEEKKGEIRGKVHTLQEGLIELQQRIRHLEEAHREMILRIHRLKTKGWAMVALASFGLVVFILGLQHSPWFSALGIGGLALGLALAIKAKREVMGKEKIIHKGLKEKEELEERLSSLSVEREKLLQELLALEEEERKTFSAMGMDSMALEQRLRELSGLQDHLKEVQTDLKVLEEREGKLKQEVNRLKEEIKSKRDELRTLEEELRRGEEEILKTLELLGVSSLQEANKKALELKEIEGKIRLLESKALRPLKEIESELREIEIRLKELQDVPLSVLEVDVEEELKAKREALRECLEQMKVLEGELKEKEKIIGMDEERLFFEIERLREEIASKERERQMLFELFRIFRLLEEEVHKELLKALEGKTLEWFKRVIGERASGLTFSDDDIVVVLDGRPLSSRQLSSGTRDPLYLCARIAIAESVKGPRTLFLDDPFLTCDLERGLRLFQLLKGLSQRFQILMATKDTWLVEVASKEGVNLIEL